MTSGAGMMKKPTLLQLREKYGINTVVLAEAAGIEPEIVYAMLVGKPVARWEVDKVLCGFKTLTGVEYKAEDIEVAIMPYQE